MKRITIALLLVIVTALTFSSCAKEKTVPVQSEVQNNENEKKTEEAQKLAGEFMNALCNMDAALMSTMCVNPESVKRRFPYDNFKDYVLEINHGNLTEKDELKKINYIDPCISCYADKVLLGNSYVIKGASKAYGGYEIAVAVETFEPAYVSEKINSIMKEDILEKKGTEISERLLKNGIVTELSTEEEIIAALYKGASEEAIPTIESQIEAAKKIKEDYVLYIVEKDGKLLVDITRSTAFFAISTDVFKIY